MGTTALPATFGPCNVSIGLWSATGARCSVAGAGRATFGGRLSIESKSGFRYCDPSCLSRTGSCKLSRCCDAPSDERSAGNLHATFCGSWGRVTAPGDPVVMGNHDCYSDCEAKPTFQFSFCLTGLTAPIGGSFTPAKPLS